MLIASLTGPFERIASARPNARLTQAGSGRGPRKRVGAESCLRRDLPIGKAYRSGHRWSSAWPSKWWCLTSAAGDVATVGSHEGPPFESVRPASRRSGLDRGIFLAWRARGWRMLPCDLPGSIGCGGTGLRSFESRGLTRQRTCGSSARSPGARPPIGVTSISSSKCRLATRCSIGRRSRSASKRSSTDRWTSSRRGIFTPPSERASLPRRCLYEG